MSMILKQDEGIIRTELLMTDDEAIKPGMLMAISSGAWIKNATDMDADAPKYIAYDDPSRVVTEAYPNGSSIVGLSGNGKVRVLLETGQNLAQGVPVRAAATAGHFEAWEAVGGGRIIGYTDEAVDATSAPALITINLGA